MYLLCLFCRLRVATPSSTFDPMSSSSSSSVWAVSSASDVINTPTKHTARIIRRWVIVLAGCQHRGLEIPRKENDILVLTILSGFTEKCTSYAYKTYYTGEYDLRLGLTLAVYMPYQFTYNSSLHAIAVYMQYQFTYNSSLHAIAVYMQYQFTYNSSLHAIAVYMQYQFTYNSSLYAITVYIQ